ncbi:MAG: glycosyltransferase family 2 protein [bacterium]|nr:glycosyltransferase family 2 protein [bacterium]
MSDNSITITFPCFNQPELLKEAVKQLEDYQSVRKVIIDDCSPLSYKDFECEECNIEYVRNEVNLGAINNMIKCIFFESKTDYIICHHEDDALHKEYLKIAIDLLDADQSLAFVTCESMLFTNSIPANKEITRTAVKKMDRHTFVMFAAENNNFAFGSTVYRRKFLDNSKVNLRDYSMLFDRPFLADLLSENIHGAVISDPLYFYRHHPYPDNRWKGLKITNIYNLYKFYRDGGGTKLVSRYFFDFAGLDNKTFPDYIFFIKTLPELITPGIPRIQSLKYFSAAVFIMLFGKKQYSLVFNRLKKIQ